ncbi:MAG: dTDP-4-dehydrorhamnose reductase [Solirubrobacterales bacterium]
MARILVTGAGGMLGSAVAATAMAAGHDVGARERSQLDITDAGAVDAALASEPWGAVINCAAWTDVDGAEEHEAQATLVNGEGPANLARACAANGVRIVHVSTDYVFAGDKEGPYVESDPTGPRSAYGRSKLAGEEAVAASGADHAIARTSWLYGAGGGNFVDTMLRLGGERDSVSVVDDQLGRPTWTGDLAPALVALATAPATGLFHAAGQGSCTWFELARTALELAGSACVVEPTTTENFPRPAPRPANSVLDTERGEEAVRLGPWQDGLVAYLNEIGADHPATAGGGPR